MPILSFFLYYHITLLGTEKNATAQALLNERKVKVMGWFRLCSQKCLHRFMCIWEVFVMSNWDYLGLLQNCFGKHYLHVCELTLSYAALAVAAMIRIL